MKIKTDIKDMKIEINEDQPILEVCKELDRLGYDLECKTRMVESWVCAYLDKTYHIYHGCIKDKFGELTTLNELRAMECL